MSQWHTDQGAPTGPWYPAPPVPRPEAESRDRQMSAWALGLSILPLLLTLVPAVVLAIIVLSRARSGRPHGQGRAVAALAVSSAWVLAAFGMGLALLIEGGLSEREAGDGVEAAGELSVVDLAVGDCFMEPKEGRLYSVRAVPCDEPHDAEVFAAFDVAGDGYPGDDAVVRAGDAGCRQRFEGFVGRPYDASDLDFYYFYPGRVEWTVHGDRQVVCSVVTVDGELVTGTLRNARR